jgi:hypothetical protein
MRAPTLFLASAVLALSGFALAQSPGPAYAPVGGWDASTLAGKWTYRSFLNDPTLCCEDPDQNKDAANLLNLLFAEAVFTFKLPTNTTLTGTIDWQGGGLDLQGIVMAGDAGRPVVRIVGTGRPKTSTEGWEYDYEGRLVYRWPNGVNQVPALVGSVIRAKPHGDNPAGVVASFIALKQP